MRPALTSGESHTKEGWALLSGGAFPFVLGNCARPQIVLHISEAENGLLTVVDRKGRSRSG